MHLKEWREAKKLTMAEAAPLLGLSQPSISRIESGDCMPSPSTIAKLIARSDGRITVADLYAERELQRETRSRKAA